MRIKFNLAALNVVQTDDHMTYILQTQDLITDSPLHSFLISFPSYNITLVCICGVYF